MASTMHDDAMRDDRMQDNIGESRSLGALFGELWRETATLFRAETQLASAELGEKVSQVETGLISVGSGIALLTAGFVILLMAAVNGLERILPPEQASWLSPLIVGAVVGIIGIAVLAKGRSNLRAQNLTPERTVRTLRDDANLGREHLQ